MQRIHILLTLLGAAGGGTGARFQEVLLARMVEALTKKEEMMASPRDWVSAQAKKRQALQEGGTLRYSPSGRKLGFLHCKFIKAALGIPTVPRLRDVCCIWRNDRSDVVFLHFSGRHTLWRHLQGVVTPLLASMVEVMDRFANLELLSDGNLSCGLVELWLNILADSQILDLTASQKPRYRGTPSTVPTMRSNP